MKQHNCVDLHILVGMYHNVSYLLWLLVFLWACPLVQQSKHGKRRFSVHETICRRLSSHLWNKKTFHYQHDHPSCVDFVCDMMLGYVGDATTFRTTNHRLIHIFPLKRSVYHVFSMYILDVYHPIWLGQYVSSSRPWTRCLVWQWWHRMTCLNAACAKPEASGTSKC